MEMNSANVEAVVKQVLESMLEKKVPEAAPAQKAAGNEIPKTAHVAMLTALEHFEIKEYPMPEVGDGDILVKVEGCGVCGGRNRPGEQGFAACSRKVRLCAGRNNGGKKGPRFVLESPLSSQVSIYMLFGIAIGMSVGQMCGQMVWGLAPGISLGLLAGVLLDNAAKKKFAG